MVAPIDRMLVVPVPGDPFAVRLIDKDTAEPFDVVAAIEAQFNAGQCAGK